MLLNDIVVCRKSLNGMEAETARQLRREGHKIQDIASRLGTNQGRVASAIGRGTGKVEDDDGGEPTLF
ncbi:hypothetical protein [Cereibacter sphaeroides]|uniref:hypothetical protein n=1 Tax=Cereibacter sphaeroides TaxID=1063 RepID=UPI000191CF7C|nr:hypothetical protein [Cereibacter sphaeroides]ACM03881.1 RNA polymerase sigma factor [Cereibacter sphaeroides KD131]